MPFSSANHFVVSGAGIDGTVDLDGITGGSVVSITVDDRELRAPSLDTTREGIVIRAIHEEVPDSHTLVVTVTIPQINLERRVRGQRGVRRADHRAHVDRRAPTWCRGRFSCSRPRPLAVTASVVES